MSREWTPRERVEAALRWEDVDHVPFTVYECMLPQCAADFRSDAAVPVAGGLAHNEPPAYEFRALVRQIQLEKLFRGHRTRGTHSPKVAMLG